MLLGYRAGCPDPNADGVTNPARKFGSAPPQRTASYLVGHRHLRQLALGAKQNADRIVRRNDLPRRLAATRVNPEIFDGQALSVLGSVIGYSKLHVVGVNASPKQRREAATSDHERNQEARSFS